MRTLAHLAGRTYRVVYLVVEINKETRYGVLSDIGYTLRAGCPPFYMQDVWD
jgi:hypothetical protein